MERKAEQRAPSARTILVIDRSKWARGDGDGRLLRPSDGKMCWTERAMASRPQGPPSVDSCNGESMKDFHEGAPRDPSDDTETRECENCGKQKPVEEMETVFARGHGETYQCIECRGGP